LAKISFPKPAVANGTSTPPPEEESPEPELTFSEHEKGLLEKYMRLWKLCHDPISSILTPSNVEPPSNGIASPLPQTANSSPTLLASVSLVPKNATVLKGGYLLTPSADSSRWVRRFVELRRPYLLVHSVPDGEEVGLVSLRNSRVDHSPQIARLLRRDGGSTGGVNGFGGGDANEERVFAVYGTDNTWLFKAKGEKEKVEWIWRIDQSYFGSSGEGSVEDD
jgi:kinesin family protein 1